LAKKKLNTLSNSDKKILKALGSRIKQIRQKKNQSVYDVTGEDLSIKSRQHWQSIENGQKNINVTTVFKIAKTLGVKPEDLITIL
jgi:transcriptional regulator with XRE-family HTH domain